MLTNINIFLILWFFIGFIFGLKITIPMMFDLNRIDDENSEYDYLTFDNILFLIPLSMLYSALGAISLFMYLIMQIDKDKKIIIKKRSK